MIEPTALQVGAAVMEFDRHTLHLWGVAPDLRVRITAMSAALRVAFQIKGDITMACEARQYSDQMSCGRCGLAWDVNDPEPPACCKTIDRRAIPDRRFTRAAARTEFNFAFLTGNKDALRVDEGERRFMATVTQPVPVELPDALALELAEVYERNRAAGLGGIESMRAAYRLFLDKLP